MLCDTDDAQSIIINTMLIYHNMKSLQGQQTNSTF